MAEISRYPTVTSYSTSDQLITYQTSSGQLVKIPISVFSEALAQTFTALTDTLKQWSELTDDELEDKWTD